MRRPVVPLLAAAVLVLVDGRSSSVEMAVEAPDGGGGIWPTWIVAPAIPAAIRLRPGARKPRS